MTRTSARRVRRVARDSSANGWRLLVALSAALALFVAAGAATAGNGHGNSGAAQACQKGGWKSLQASTGETFKNSGECTSYAARGGKFRADEPEPVGADVSLQVQTTPASGSVAFSVRVVNDGPFTVTVTVATTTRCVYANGPFPNRVLVESATLTPGAEGWLTNGSYACTIEGYSQVIDATMLDPDSTPDNYANGYDGPAVEDDEAVFSVTPETE